MRRPLSTFLLLLFPLFLIAQTPAQEAKMAEKLEKFFTHYKAKGQVIRRTPKLQSYLVDNEAHTLLITADDSFSEQEFTPDITADIYRKLSKELPKPYNKYQLTLVTNGMTIDELIPNRLSNHPDKSRLWGDIDYKGKPWVRNMSRPTSITHGLEGRHIMLWASHGMYYDQKKAEWRWQRPKLFGTTEDLFTQTIVVPYLIPMLERAGAVVVTPRERAWQKEEVIIDNDGPRRNYIEVTAHGKWKTTTEPGFAYHTGMYADGENPFTEGTARMTKTTSSKSRYSMATYQPDFPKTASYAVYVSYQTLPNSIDDVEYTVWHRGEKTIFHVNQQMGGGTWVYLGTFDFDAGYSEFNRVTVSNQSSHSGVVTTDAVRFGGGMGNIERGGSVSGMPRALEGARYTAQWAGMPYSVYSSKEGQDDYADDINARSLMENYLGGGSCFMPTKEGLRVPIELSLAVHSDAGYAKDGESIIGALAICTTNFNEGRLDAGVSRLASRDLADELLSNEVRDIKVKYGQWNRRELYDRNYSETRLPAVPSAILETMSHQNFPDMRYGQDPNFRFTLARSIYKTILRYVNDQHGDASVVQPLAPDNFRVEFTSKNKVRLQWSDVVDPQESSSKPTGYIVYTSRGGADFDNGTYVRSRNSYDMELEPGLLYHFRVSAVNRGGESSTTETLSALYQPQARQTVMIVNGFHRLSSPAIRNTPDEQGFDLDDDPGITYGRTAGWSGRQLVFDRTKAGLEGEGSLGWSGSELAGMFIAGNDFNYVATHAEAISSAHEYNIVSCSSEAVETAKVNLSHYNLVDLVLGLERNDGHSLVYYKTFSTAMQQALRSYTAKGGALLVSGAYPVSDMMLADEQQFTADVLKCGYGGQYRQAADEVSGMGTTLQFHHQLNEEHYAATVTDILRPTRQAFAVLRYADGSDACIAYRGSDYRVLTIGFPFECIKSSQKRDSMMRGLLNFLLK